MVQLWKKQEDSPRLIRPEAAAPEDNGGEGDGGDVL